MMRLVFLLFSLSHGEHLKFFALQVRYLEEIGFSEVKASRLYIYSGLASLLIRPVIGRINDVNWIDPCYIYAIAAIVEGVVTFFLPAATSSLHFILFFVVYGLADGTMGCGLSIAVLNSLPERLRPLGFGVYQCLTCLTSASGPALGGKLQFFVLGVYTLFQNGGQ